MACARHLLRRSLIASQNPDNAGELVVSHIKQIPGIPITRVKIYRPLEGLQMPNNFGELTVGVMYSA